MSLLTKTANDVFAPHDVSGAVREIVPQDAQVWGTEVERLLLSFQAGGGIIFASKATMDATLTYAANQQAWVLGDATVANNGVYRKIGASGTGSWVRVGDLPYSFISAMDVGAGTANALQAATSIPVSASALVVVNVFRTNTATPVTISFNGGSALTIKAFDGADIIAAGLTAGMVIAGFASGSTFRMISDQSRQALIAAMNAAVSSAQAARDAAEAAQDAAEDARDIAAGYASDAVSQGNVPIIGTLLGLSGLSIPAGIDTLRVNGYSSTTLSGGQAIYKPVAAPPSHDLKRTSLDGRNWTVAESVLTPVVAGAVGNGELGASATDDTSALQRVLNFYKFTRPASRQRDNQRRLDLQGKTYRVSAPLSIEGCDGLEICNGTLIVDPSNPFAANRAVLEHDVSGVELWGFTTRNLTIQCNQVANGILINRPQEVYLDNPTVLGWGQREFGIRMGPVAYSADINILAPCVSGFAVSFADNPVSTRTGIGIDLQTADSEILGGNVNTGLVPIRIHSSGSVRACHVWNGNPGNEAIAAANNIGIEYINGHSSTSCLIGNTMDNSCIVLNGQSLYKQIVGNHFYSNQDQLEAGIFLRASAAGQAIADLLITDNIFHGYYLRPVKIEQTAGTYTSVARVLVADNPCRSFKAGYNAYAESLAASRGSIQVAVSTGSFNGSGVVKFNLGARALLFPTYGDALSITAGHMRNTSGELSGSSIVFQGWWYDTATGILWLKYSGAFNGRLKIDFDQSYMSRFWDPEPAS